MIAQKTDDTIGERMIEIRGSHHNESDHIL